MTLLLSYALKSSVVLFLALAGVRLLRRRSAAFRHSLIAAAVMAAAAVPVLTLVLPSSSIPVPGPIPAAAAVVDPAPEQYYEVEAFPPSAAPSAAAPAEPIAPANSPAPSINPAQLLFWLWIAGVGVMFADLATGLAQLLCLSRHARVLTEGIWVKLAEDTARRYGLSKRIRLLETSGTTVLATWGLFRPQLLLPAGASSWPEERIQVVLHHELAHVQRHDWLIQMSAEILRAVYWFNPLCWIACESLVQESEQACDDIALSSGIAGPDYAQQLLALTVALQHPAPALSAAMSMARPSTLERRFVALLNPRENRTRITRGSMVLTLAVVLAVTGPIASLQLDAESGLMTLPQPSIGIPAIEPLQTLSTALAALLPQQVPPAPVAAAGAGSIEGTVVKFGTSEPIAGADVSLQMLPGPPTLIQTGADGKFIFRNLPAGNYRLVALRAEGFVVAEHGQQSPNGRGRPVPVAEGQTVGNIRLAMMPTGSISGRILDRDGEPLGRAQVQALQATYRQGRKILKIVQSVQTNDIGEYRLFWLPPGSYYVSARPEDTRRRAVPLFVSLPGTGGVFEQAAPPVITHRVQDNEVSEEAFVLVYFPGTIDFSTASRVDVHAGDALGGVNFSVGSGQIRSRHVRGRVVDGNGQPLTSGNVLAISRTLHPNATIPSAALDDNGRFDIAGVVPGSYYLVAGNPPSLQLLNVAGSDVENIVFTTKGGVELNGRVVIEGKPSLETDPDMVKLQRDCGDRRTLCLPVRVNFTGEPALVGFPQENPMPGMPGVDMFVAAVIPNGAVLANGTFTLRNLLARDYQLTFTGLPPDWYVKSARLGTTDAIANLISFATQPAEQLEVVLGTNGGRMEGRVVNAAGQAVASASVALIPEPSQRARRDLYRNAVTDETGSFRFQAIAPGEYKVFAWEEIDLSSWQDPEVIRPFENRGKAVRIAEGGRETVEAVVIPAQR
jgi:beta-lactamase regulating signal transducer with metallopeptidase domain